MKRFFILIIFSYFATSVFSQLNISGNVSDLTAIPVSNHPVLISCDSIPIILVFTDNSGNYLYNDTNYSCLGFTRISTIDGYGNIHNYFGTSLNITHDFQIYVDTLLISANCSSSFSYSNIGTLDILFVEDFINTNSLISFWDFGDGNISFLSEPHHHFEQGTYNVCLTIIDSSGCFDTYCEIISVDSIPNCNAQFYSTIAASDTIINFVDISYSDGVINEWHWDFGDSSTSIQQNPSHTYQYFDTFNVCLSIITNELCSDTLCSQISYLNQNPECYADFNSFHDSLTCSGCFSFIDNTAATGSVLNWFWNFDDGDTSFIQNPNHVYVNYGIYNVCLYISTSDNCVNYVCDSVYYLEYVPFCNANFSYYVDTSLMGNNYYFSDSSNASGNIIAWFWDFGDGENSNEQNPNHIYSMNGIYEVCLEIFTNDSCYSEFCDTVVINSIIPKFSISGQVTENSQPILDGNVYLFGHGASWNDSIFNGGYIFPDLDTGNYIVYVIPEFSIYPNLVSTYYGNSFFWAEASEINLFEDFTNADIQLIGFDNNNGNDGIISGTIFYVDSSNISGNYIRDLNESVEDISVLLFNLEDNLTDYVLSDASGHFLFQNLSFGTYKIYIEITGYVTFPAIVIIDEGNIIVENIEIIINGNEIVIGIENDISNRKSTTMIFPNPVKETLNIGFSFNENIELEISIYNMIGQNIYTNKSNFGSGEHIWKVDVNSLPNGLFSLLMQVNNKDLQIIKFVK